jgi:acyl-CoA synthetase (AMP-forming)/AMP-acid ligase II
MSDRCCTLSSLLAERARVQPERTIYRWLRDGEVESATLTYGELARQARRIASRLAHFISPGDRILLVYPPGLEFIPALFGCLYAGAIAVPAHPPAREAGADATQALVRIAENCTPVACLTLESIARQLQGTDPHGLRSVEVIATDAVYGGLETEFAPHPARPDDLALLQYTSGSTGDPKGVMLTHAAILHNERDIARAFQHDVLSPDGVGVCWLPFQHDMGLIGNVLQALYVGRACYVFSPVTMLQRPIRWLEAISRYRAHTSGGPNFAYEQCARRITAEQKAGLDLSSWRIAYIGAEPISPAVIQSFTEAFAECGFRPEAFYPCYGLAEASLMVSGGSALAPPVIRRFRVGANRTVRVDDADNSGDVSTEQWLVGCGHARDGSSIAIVDPATATECDSGQIGEIWFSGPSVAQGYWNREQESHSVFQAPLVGRTPSHWLRTGDLGFIHDGELFVCGRLKDLIVIHGQNHSPEDIEQTVAGLNPAFRAGLTAAFGCTIDGEERLIVLQEVDRAAREIDAAELDRLIRRAVAERHQIQVHDIALLQHGALPKTTSGKVRRHAARENYLRHELKHWQPLSPR